MIDDIRAKIENVNKEGQVDMLDRFMVAKQCERRGHLDAANWISRNPRTYARYIVEIMSFDQTEATNWRPR